MIAEPGPASIAEAFGINDYPLETALEFLLRRHKGEFYRARLPDLLPWRDHQFPSRPVTPAETKAS